MKKKPVTLIIMDGQGVGDKGKGDAVYSAKTPILDDIYHKYGTIQMRTFGEEVGLPEGQMGNSEVGHTNLGAGRIVRQGLSRINYAINEDKSFYKNKKILNWINHAKTNSSKLHILGLTSEGGVHSHYDHIAPIVEMANEQKLTVYIHMITDGRDVSPTSARTYLENLNKMLKGKDYFIATISGRYYTMDRDKRWERIQLAYDTMVSGSGKTFKNLETYISDQYKEEIYDEFIIPACNEEKRGLIEDDDAIFFINFRPDRARQISHMFIGSKLWDYSPPKMLKNLNFTSMMNYDQIDSHVVFPLNLPVNTLGEWAEHLGLSQLRAAETEKYPHVTFFFDGGKENDWKNSKKLLVNSPKVATYDLKPEMSAIELTDKILECIENYDVAIINYANPDMVGHTGKIPAVIKAVETVDTMIGRLYKKIVTELSGTMIITADHGNADEMLNSDNSPMTKHSTNPVYVTITNNEFKFKDKFKKNYIAKLADIAPTMLKILDVDSPDEMDGEILVEKK